MALSRFLSLFFIVAGGAIALYAQAEQRQNTYLLIVGIALLMIGIYRVSRNIPSKNDNEDTTVIQSEDTKDDKDRG